MKTLLKHSSETLQFAQNKLLMKVIKIAMGRIPEREPTLFIGTQATEELAELIAKKSSKPFIVTTAGAVKRGQLNDFVVSLEKYNLSPTIYDKTLPDPTFKIVNDGITLCKQQACDCVIAFGGGSPMDAAKVIALGATNEITAEKLIGLRKAKQNPLPFYAIPTTAGTASEVTISAVISDDTSHAKDFVIDSRTVSRATAFDPQLTMNLPADITAATGMDALTHAIEAYISRNSSPKTDALAVDAIKSIFTYLPKAYTNGKDLEARKAMALASYTAGKAFNKAMLGYVHAISHQLGAVYGTPHGQGNAIALPHVVAFSEPAIRRKLAKLALETGLGDNTLTEQQLSQRLVDHLQELNRQLGISSCLPELQEKDIPKLAKLAFAEAISTHPVPRHMRHHDIENLLRKLLP